MEDKLWIRDFHIRHVAKLKEEKAPEINEKKIFEAAAAGDVDCIQAKGRFYMGLAHGYSIFNMCMILKRLLSEEAISAHDDLLSKSQKKWI
jgi:hypothetical protein